MTPLTDAAPSIRDRVPDEYPLIAGLTVRPVRVLSLMTVEAVTMSALSNRCCRAGWEITTTDVHRTLVRLKQAGLVWRVRGGWVLSGDGVRAQPDARRWLASLAIWQPGDPTPRQQLMLRLCSAEPVRMDEIVERAARRDVFLTTQTLHSAAERLTANGYITTTLATPPGHHRPLRHYALSAKGEAWLDEAFARQAQSGEAQSAAD